MPAKKTRKYLTRRVWPALFWAVSFILSEWIINLLFRADPDLWRIAHKSIVGLWVVAGAFYFWRLWKKSLNAEAEFRAKRILCIYCAYILDKDRFVAESQVQCPECGNHQTREELLSYWDLHFDVSGLFDEPDQEV